MFKNYFKIALRNILKEKIYFVINILGLTIGLAACLVILLYVKSELSYDRFHSKADRIYRVIEKRIGDEPVTYNVITPEILMDFSLPSQVCFWK